MPSLMRHARSLWLIETRAGEEPWQADLWQQVTSGLAANREQLTGARSSRPDGSDYLSYFCSAVRAGMRRGGAFQLLDAAASSTRELETSLAAGPWHRWWLESRKLVRDPEAAVLWSSGMLAEAMHTGAWAALLLLDMARPVAATSEVRELERVIAARPHITPLFTSREVFGLADRALRTAPTSAETNGSDRGRWAFGHTETDIPAKLPDSVVRAWRHWASARTIDESLRRGIACALEDNLPEIRAQEYIWVEWPELICPYPSPTLADERLEEVWLPSLKGLSGAALQEPLAAVAARRGFSVGLQLAGRQSSWTRTSGRRS